MSVTPENQVRETPRRRASLPFERWLPSHKHTLAYYLFRRDLSALNSFTWHAQGTVNNAEYMIHKASESEQIRKTLNYGADPGRRSDTIVKDARFQFKETENWIRLTTIILTASALELFVRRVMSLSLLSDPGLLILAPRTVDGVFLLKHGKKLEISEHVKSCSEGTWSTRASSIARIFGQPVDTINKTLKDLQYVQDLRNSVAHELGRKSTLKDFWYIDPKLAEPTPISKLSGERLQKLLRVVGAVALELDTRCSHHVGSFEMMMFWKEFLDKRTDDKSPVLHDYVKLFSEGGSAKLLSTFHHTITGATLSRIFCKGLIAHFNAA